ncbi:MAG: hypothetical protein AB7K52_12610 [Phycisphaerales bacterium]
MTPACQHCGYDLTGMKVEGNCPECGKPIWSAAAPDQADALARRVQLWGILSLVLLFVCLGPLAAFLTIPAFMAAAEFDRTTNKGITASPSATSMVQTGRICARIAATLSILFVGVYALLFLLALLGH